MLRIWGGGIYNPHAFYEACDREGILVWHDFMFACAPYPDHLEWFRDEVAKEADHQTRRLRNHACLALWSGSNECHYCLGIGTERETDKVTRLLGRVLPKAVEANCPEIPYWYSSPAGGSHVNDPAVGDCHYWGIMMNADIDVRITPEHFDECEGLFVSEFGYPGPCCKATTEQYLAGAPFDRAEEVWQHHNNTFEKDTVDAGIARHYADPAAMSPEEYLLYGGLAQGLTLGYELEALRASPRCHGALFWMYNDCWGEVGWTVIDYYLRRKISYWFVRRAFARGKRDPRAGLWYARVVGRSDVLPGILRAAEPAELAAAPALELAVGPAGGGQYDVTVGADAYARAVELLLPEQAVPEDNYFELLPGERRIVRVASRRRLSDKNVSALCR